MDRRIKALSECLDSYHLDAFIVDDPIDLFYLLDLKLSVGRLIVKQKSAHLFVDGRYFEACKKKTNVAVHLQSDASLRPVLKGNIGFDEDKTSYQAFLALRRLSREGGKLIPQESLVLKQRQIKEGGELKKLREAAALGSLGYDFVLKQLKEGISEKEVVKRLKIFWLEKEGEGAAFSPIIAFGSGAAHPHYRSGDRRLKEGDPVLIDIGVTYQGYHSDMTRTINFGKPHPKMAQIFEIVKEGQKRALTLCKEGAKISEVEKAARDHITSEGFGDYFPHSLGHGIGLEVHELPYLRSSACGQLVSGMVITIEPGIYLPGLGGVRIEDTIMINKKGYTNFTNRPTSFLF
ncbi:MAG: aminopeptidase P family protein [Chlamydiia bacterium]|nr:aminopeptidase P family protein [Chlamydiia bacterium]